MAEIRWDGGNRAQQLGIQRVPRPPALGSTYVHVILPSLKFLPGADDYPHGTKCLVVLCTATVARRVFGRTESGHEESDPTDVVRTSGYGRERLGANPEHGESRHEHRGGRLLRGWPPVQLHPDLPVARGQ